MKPIIAIIGRSNVGKSTLFNRISEEWISITDNLFEVTRDRIYKEINWQGYDFIITDTGGIEGKSINLLKKLIEKQTIIALDEANLILMLVDSKSGITDEDIRIAKIIKRKKKNVILVVNKVDNFNKNNYYEFYSLGLGNPIPISAIHGNNVGDLLDLIIEKIIKENKNKYYKKNANYKNLENDIKIALIGAPNVGKSTLINKLSNKNRAIVSDLPGTTRDSINEEIVFSGEKYIFIDTAGIKKKSKNKDFDFLEKKINISTLRAIEKTDIVLFLIDPTKKITEKDKKISEIIIENGKGIVIIINKWDKIKKNNSSIQIFTKKIKENFYLLNFAPILFISALTGQRLNKIYKLSKYVYVNNNKKIETSLLNKLLKEIITFNPPPKKNGKSLKINYITQKGIAPPSFILFVNDVNLMHFSYKRHIENKLRESFDFIGTPIKLYFKNKKGEK